MNERNMPCVNTILLNRYMKEQDWEAARDEAIESAKAEALAADITDDDIIEFAEILQMKDSKHRERFRRAMNDLNHATYTRQEMGYLAASITLDILNETRAHRAEQKFWEEV